MQNFNAVSGDEADDVALLPNRVRDRRRPRRSRGGGTRLDTSSMQVLAFSASPAAEKQCRMHEVIEMVT